MEKAKKHKFIRCCSDEYEYWLLSYSELEGEIPEFVYTRDVRLKPDFMIFRFRGKHSVSTQTCVLFEKHWRDSVTLEKVHWRDEEVLHEWLAQYRLAKKLGKTL